MNFKFCGKCVAGMTPHIDGVCQMCIPREAPERPLLNDEQIEFVKRLRLRGSWRWMAEQIADRRPDILEAMGWTWGGAYGNQVFGMEVCRVAGVNEDE